MQSLRELRAITVLVLRSWQRLGPRLRGGQKPEPTRGATAVLMRLVFLALIYNFGFTASLRVAHEPQPIWAATWCGIGAGLFSFAIGLSLELPSPRAPAQALKNGFLDLLPVSRLSRLMLLLAQAFLGLPLSIGLSVSLHGQLWDTAPLLPALLLGACLFVGSAAAGGSFGRLIKLRLSAYRAAKLGWVSSILMLAGMLLFQVGTASKYLPRPRAAAFLGRALVGEAPWTGVLELAGAALLACLGFVLLERRQELAEPVRPDRVPSAFADGVDMRKLERLLGRREPGGRLQVPMAVGISGAFVAWLTATVEPSASGPRFVWNFVVILTLQLVTTLGMQRATRGATRDMLARPLLGALPISPSDTLVSKASTLRKTLLTVAAPIVLVLGASKQHPAWLTELGWRVAATLAATTIYASAATYVAFLTAGLGTTRPRGGVFGSLESFLLAVPFASVLFAPSPISAGMSLVTLAALTFEARRAALRTIDWLDDADQEHATEVWKALVVFGGFQGAQLLAQQMASVFDGLLSPSVQLLAAYALSALVLWLLTLREQRDSSPELGLKLAPLGLVTGALSAALAWAYLKLAAPSLEGVPRLELHGTADFALVGITIAGVAPLVEERFFRGWLQLALEKSLGTRGWLAPLLSALAFAIVHPVHSFIPVLVLGLLNGLVMRRFRSLAACVVAHCLHNAFALYLGS